jgi:hypothetical protein
LHIEQVFTSRRKSNVGNRGGSDEGDGSSLPLDARSGDQGRWYCASTLRFLPGEQKRKKEAALPLLCNIEELLCCPWSLFLICFG